MLHTIPEPIREIFVNRPMWKFELDGRGGGDR
jgi:hypothetical protein